jgi:hypothetical protein
MRPLFLSGFVAVLATAGAAWGFDFVGPESCKGCHPEAYQQWKLSKHARAKDSLSPAQAKDARCLSCHSPNEADQRTSDISCETCHGGGRYYATSYVMKDSELVRAAGLVDPSEKGCRTCHDASSPSLKPFDFVEKLKLVNHWTADKAPAAAPEMKKK